MDTKFNSKISSWLFLPLIFFLGIMLVITIIDKNWGGAIILIAVTIFILSFLFRTYYVVEGQVLKIVSGFVFKKEIDIMSIRKIEKTNTPLSSPALSLKDRIEIYYSKFDSVIISPERQSEFIATLKLINKNISTNL